MLRTSPRGCLASLTTKAVISLVIDAIGSTACEFLLNKISFVSWSSTSATLDLRSSGSLAACRPLIWPKDGRAGCALTARAREALVETFFLLTASGLLLRGLDSAGIGIAVSAAKAITQGITPRRVASFLSS